MLFKDMFFEEDMFEIFENEMWLPILASVTEEEIEDEERDFFDMSDEEIRSYYE